MTNIYKHLASFKAFWMCVFFLFTLATTQAQQWVPMNGPYGGSITSFVSNGTAIFAGTFSQGVFRSTNNGDTWTQANTGLTGIHVSTLVVSGATIYAGTTDGGVFRSSDNGEHWTHVNVGKRPIVMSMIVSGSTIIVASNEPDRKDSYGLYLGVVYRSLDNGNTWEEFNLFLYNPNIESLAVIGTTFLAGSRYGVLYVNSNNGSSWEYIRSFGDRDISFAVNGTNLIASAHSTGIYQSKDSGKIWQWKKVTFDITSLAANSSAIFAGSDTGGVYRSTDSCATWTQVNTGLTNPYIQTLYISGSTLFAGTKSGGVFRSLDNGTTWKEVNIGLRGLTVSAFTSSSTSLFAGTYEAGVFRSTDNGRDWSTVNIDAMYGNPFPTYNIRINSLATSGTSIIASTSDGVQLSTDNGEHWKWIKEFTGSCSILVTDTIIFAYKNSYNQPLYRSVDKGYTWKQDSTNAFKFNRITQLVMSGTTLFAGTSNNVAGAKDNGVYWSDDFGNSWVQANLRSQNLKEVKSIKLLFASGNTLIATTDKGENFRSTDKGETWTEIVFSDLKKLESLVFIASDSAFFVGTDSGGVFRSVDNGITWTEYNSGLTAMSIRSLAIHDNNLFAGTTYGVWRYGNKDATLPIEPITCYPNPANTILTIQQTNQSFNTSTPVTYTMYNLLGMQAMHFERSESEFTIPITSLAMGMYTLVARQGDVRSSTVFYVAR